MDLHRRPAQLHAARTRQLLRHLRLQRPDPGRRGRTRGWPVSTPTVGPTPAHTRFDESPDVPNLVWTYHGRPLTGSVRLGEFWAVSNSGSSGDGLFVGRNARSWDGKSDTNITETKIPAPAPGVPEPGTFVLAGAGLSLLGVARRVRSYRAARG